MIIAVASGKGGTGKTTVAVNLARVIESRVLLIDCDVEEPNCHLFLDGTIKKTEIATVLVPLINESLCIGCGECARFCEYNAIASFGTTPLIFPEICHSCGGCAKLCPQHAITEVDKRIGTIRTIENNNITLVQGILDVGVAAPSPLIHKLKAYIPRDQLTILDAPPGTSCSVVATLHSVDFVILVTEPTSFGLNDLKLAVQTVRQLELPFAVIINRADRSNNNVNHYCQSENISVLSEIPDDRQIAEVYSRGELLIEALPKYRNIFNELARRLTKYDFKLGV